MVLNLCTLRQLGQVRPPVYRSRLLKLVFEMETDLSWLALLSS